MYVLHNASFHNYLVWLFWTCRVLSCFSNVSRWRSFLEDLSNTYPTFFSIIGEGLLWVNKIIFRKTIQKRVYKYFSFFIWDSYGIFHHSLLGIIIHGFAKIFIT
jgi:hypothetical protein